MAKPKVDDHDWIGCMLVTVAKKLIARVDEELRPLELDARSFGSLDTIARHSGITQQELGQLRLTDPAIVVGLVDSLQGAGWVQRTPDPRDRRRNMLSLTEPGVAIWKKASAMVRRCEQQVLGADGPAIAERLAVILDAKS
jgi:DNA-binding MarR family transcriptional regulator